MRLLRYLEWDETKKTIKKRGKMKKIVLILIFHFKVKHFNNNNNDVFLNFKSIALTFN